MQQTYRRRTYTRQRKDNFTFIQSCRKSIIKQTAVSLLIFAAMLMVKMSANTSFDRTKSAICYTIVNNTDWQGAFESVHSFIKEKVSADKSLNEHELLTKMETPTDGKVISEFGMRTDSKTGKDNFHYGVDFSGSIGDKIRCASDGTVGETGYSDEYGNFILIKHNDKISSFYAHCERVLPVAGDKIKSGQVIATLGNSGNVSDPCLHFEIREGDTSLDPMVFLEDK